MEYLVRLVKNGKLKVIIDQVYDMEDGLKVRHDLSFTPLLRPRLQAYERILSQRARGQGSSKGPKLVIREVVYINLRTKAEESK